MRWATRSGIHVDRAASAWLIATYIDADATFEYVEDPMDVPDDAIPFDMIGAALTHVGGDVTFETILRTYELNDPVLWRIGEIIHQADVEDERFDAPEAAGLDIIIRALGQDHDDEGVRLLTSTILTSLEVHLRRESLHNASPVRGTRSRP